MVQIITYDIDKYSEYNNSSYKVSKFSEIQALDDYKICVIDLNSEELWENDGDTCSIINMYRDLLTIKEAIKNSIKSQILIVLPQNEKFKYSQTYKYENNIKKYYFTKSIQLKDNKDNLIGIINKNLFDISKLQLVFEKTQTLIEDKRINADFNFINYEESLFESITFSKGSNKVTTIKKDKVFLTTLNIVENQEIFKGFIDEYLRDKTIKDCIPEWMNNINFFNDLELKEQKDNNMLEIKKLEEKNELINVKLDENLEYKSILYSTGDELVNVVLRILDEIFDNDSSTFIDEKKEDFLIVKDDVTFIGEIKGLSSSVKNENISQLEVHIQNYFDKLQETGREENVKGILIINHQRNKPLEERQAIHEHQRKLAIKYESLIVETDTLLKLYEKYKLGKITQEESQKMFKENIGLLTL